MKKIILILAVVLLTSCTNTQSIDKSQSRNNEAPEVVTVLTDTTYENTNFMTNPEISKQESSITTSIANEVPPTTEPAVAAASMPSSTAAPKDEASEVTTGLCSLPKKENTSDAKAAAEETKADNADSDQDEEVLIDEDNISLEIGAAITPGGKIISEQFKDYIIVGEEYGKVYYINVSNDSTWNQREYVKGEWLMCISEVSSERDLAKLESGTASLLASGTNIYKCSNEPMMLLADIDGVLLPYYKMVEG